MRCVSRHPAFLLGISLRIGPRGPFHRLTICISLYRTGEQHSLQSQHRPQICPELEPYVYDITFDIDTVDIGDTTWLDCPKSGVH